MGPALAIGIAACVVSNFFYIIREIDECFTYLFAFLRFSPTTAPHSPRQAVRRKERKAPVPPRPQKPPPPKPGVPSVSPSSSPTPSVPSHAPNATLQHAGASAPSPSPRLEPKERRNRVEDQQTPVVLRRPGSGGGDPGECKEVEHAVVTVGGQNREGVQVIAVNSEDVKAGRDDIGKHRSQ